MATPKQNQRWSSEEEVKSMATPKQKQRWSREEEDALRRGVFRYGVGRWKMIQEDPEFGKFLALRSNVDLKDKWRNMDLRAGQASHDKIKTPKPIAHPNVALPVLNIPPIRAAPDVSLSTLIDNLKNTDSWKSYTQWYNGMTHEKLSTIKYMNGSETNSMGFIEVENCHKIIKDGMPGQNTHVVGKKNEHLQKKSQPCANKTVDVEIRNAAKVAADWVADAESCRDKASEAAERADKSAEMVKESDSLLKFAEDIFERCSRGEVVYMK